MRKFNGIRTFGVTAIAGGMGLLVAGGTALPNDVATTDGMGGSADAGSVGHTTAPGEMSRRLRMTENHLQMTDLRSTPAPAGLPFEKLVTRIHWPRGKDGTDQSLFAYGPSAKNPEQAYSSQLIDWTVDINKVAAVDVTINGKRADNPRDAKQAHTAIYRLGGQPIPGYTGAEGYFKWRIWPKGNFKFDFTVYDDAGTVIGTMSRIVTVAPMPAG